jgi:hypothetical protein
MEPKVSKIRFQFSGYFFIALVIVVLAGFWPSYFSKFFNGTNDFAFYFHFHATIMMLWIASLILQPILIKKKMLEWHRFIGRLSYILFPLIFVSVIFVTHSRHPLEEKDLDLNLFIPFKDLVILGTAYAIAIVYRHKVELHARGMIATGIVFIEPSLSRLFDYTIAPFPTAYFLTITTVFLLLVGLIILERNQQQGRWVFPLILALYIMMHSIIILEIHITPWVYFSKWFASLPLT